MPATLLTVDVSKKHVAGGGRNVPGLADEPLELGALSDAFQALGGDPRVRVVAALATAEDGRASFTELFEATDVETTAGFAYHLRQLDGQFVRSVVDDADDAGDAGDGDPEEGYALTDAGRRVARAIATGAYTDSVEIDAIPLDDACPLCRSDDGLQATVDDNVTTVACTDCGRDVLALPFPPSGYATRDPETVPDAVDRHHRRRIASHVDGVCPDCGGPATSTVEPLAAAEGDPTEHHRVRVAFACDACGATASTPLSLAVLHHPAVVAAYHEHGVDVRDRPLWTVGADWRERVLSTDPWSVRATMETPNDDEDDDDDDDVLAAYVGADATVVHVEELDEQEAPARITADAPDDGTGEDATGEDGTPA